jgi:hypothetical protein
MKNLRNIILFCLFILCSCGFPSVEDAQLRYITKPAFDLPKDIVWEEIGFAKELVNVRKKLVVMSGGSNPIPLNEWDKFKVTIPWKKNIDRNLLFTKTALLRSPNASFDCRGEKCLIEREYKGYSWIELADPIAIDFIPKETDTMKPEEGHLTVKVIKKCQVTVFENEIFEMSDDKGNKYVMHATETGEPNLEVKLPPGFKIRKVEIDKPLVVVPFGEKEDCYFNIVGDHLGQGYHQYEYASEYYPR